ncbi:MAG: hypothetical protein IPK82_40805 [Polyangiaceae bacterium]|nr:hypothetical protein [Polyangiaceae bacterium]
MPNIRLRPHRGGFAERVSYRLDRFLSLHPVVQLLAVLVWATLLALLFGAVSLVLGGGTPREMGAGLWWAITHMLDGGTVAQNQGFLPRFVGIGVTLVGMVLVAIVTGAFASSFADRLRDIRRGTSSIFEHNHILLLGYGERADVLIRELAASGLRTTVVIVTTLDRDRVEERTVENLTQLNHHLRVIVRRADPETTSGALGASAKRASAIVILPENEGQPSTFGEARDVDEDVRVVRSLLAARRAIGNRRVPMFVEVAGERGRDLVSMCGSQQDLTLVEEGDVGTHLLVHSVRQPGVLDVVHQILALDSRTVYMHRVGAFSGSTFDEAHAAIEPGVLIGILTGDRQIRLVPPGNTRLNENHTLLVLADDDKVPVKLGSLPVVKNTVPAGPMSQSASIHVLVVGYRPGLDRILRALFAHKVRRVSVLVRPARAAAAREALAASGFGNDGVVVEGDPSDESSLSRALARGPNRLLLLARDVATAQASDRDADQLITLLTLRRLMRGPSALFPAVVEIHDAETERLIGGNHDTDFVLLHELAGRLLAQELHAVCLSDFAGAWLGDVFHKLLDDMSTRVWFRPLQSYFGSAPPATFGEIQAAARARGEIAIGVRVKGSKAELLPKRRDRFDTRDTHVVVLGEAEQLGSIAFGEGVSEDVFAS